MGGFFFIKFLFVYLFVGHICILSQHLYPCLKDLESWASIGVSTLSSSVKHSIHSAFDSSFFPHGPHRVCLQELESLRFPCPSNSLLETLVTFTLKSPSVIYLPLDSSIFAHRRLLVHVRLSASWSHRTWLIKATDSATYSACPQAFQNHMPCAL